MKQSILITGASGFVGKHLCNKLKENYNLFTLTSKNYKLLKNQYKNIKIDYIIHLAVKTAAGGYCQNHPGEQFLVNTQINLEILEFWKNFQPNSKFITFGSSCGYGDNVYKVETNYLLNEPETGYEVYGNIKRNLLIGLKALKKEYNMDYSYFIPSLFYGPEFELEDNHFIFDIIKKIYNGKINNETVTLWGSGDQKRELIYIEDAVDIIVKCLNEKIEIANLSSGSSLSIKTYAKTICDLLNYDFNLIKWDTNQFIGALDKNLVNTTFKNYNFTTTEKGIKKTLEYYVKKVENKYET